MKASGTLVPTTGAVLVIDKDGVRDSVEHECPAVIGVYMATVVQPDLHKVQIIVATGNPACCT